MYAFYISIKLARTYADEVSQKRLWWFYRATTFSTCISSCFSIRSSKYGKTLFSCEPSISFPIIWSFNNGYLFFYFSRKVTTHFVGDSGITLAWVRIFLIVIWNSLICFLYKSDLQHMFPWLVSVINQFYCRDGCSNILWVSFSEKITSWKF